ncbi:MAG: carboxypeptidase-like regulatory domain-containing protein, partial [Saprospiraceae bacterium]|nr:carboxypeptidase-like regulatory domain-containing protein [Saprospiraceae bacterium]
MKVKWLLICLFFCTSSLLWAQKQISGTVTSEDGEPLIGVNVVEKGTVNGASTDLDGNFTLTVAGESSVLVISYTGMRSIEQPVGTQTQFNISLSFQSELLEAIVVSALGFKQDKDKLGSTASVVSANDVVRSGETGV